MADGKKYTLSQIVASNFKVSILNSLFPGYKLLFGGFKT
jgi:hypothetical protein